jgi:hypothetical protein
LIKKEEKIKVKQPRKQKYYDKKKNKKTNETEK